MQEGKVDKEAYTFWGLHNLCENDEGQVFHEVYVPDMHCVIGTGETLDEAMAEASLKLTCEINDMSSSLSHTSKEGVHALGLEQATATRDPDVPDFKTRYVGVVAVSTLPGRRVPDLSDEEVARLDRLAREL